MQNEEALTPKQIEAFLTGSAGIAFSGQTRKERYRFIQEELVRQEYSLRRKPERGAIRAYLSKVTGMSFPQLTRLIRQYRATGLVAAAPYVRRRFARKYEARDIVLLAEVDRAHQWLSGPATVRILAREHRDFGHAEYERLAGLSVAHLYNLRRSPRYRKATAGWEHTRPSAVEIGERRRPDPQGRPGYLRVDTVHQGDWEGVKGVYHINAVDAVTQWQVVGCTGRITEEALGPVLEAILHQFPFRIRGFHTDNGSEYVNHDVDGMLKKLLIEFTRSRAYRTQDNALVEGKNGAIIRKHIGYGHIGAEHAGAVDQFYRAFLNWYLAYHRPCGFATVTLDPKGKQRRRYPHEEYVTPYEKFLSLPQPEQYLKAHVSLAQLEQIAWKMSDTECARRMTTAKVELLRRVKIESPVPPRRWPQ